MSLLLKRLAIVGQTKVAEVTGIDHTLISRFVSGERGLRIDQIQPVMAALGLVLVEANGETRTISADEHEALKLLARKGLTPMICPRCKNPHDDPHHKKCAYCLVADSTHYWHRSAAQEGAEDQAREAYAEQQRGERECSEGGWIDN